MKFKHLHFGEDDEEDSCLHYTFVDRKSFAMYDINKEITFFIYDNPGEEYINAYKYVQKYFDIIAKCGIKVDQEQFVFPNIRKGQFVFKTQGTTDYYRSTIQKVADQIGLVGRDYGNHSLRYGGARHKLIFSVYPYNLEQIRYIAGWTYQDTADTIGIAY